MNVLMIIYDKGIVNPEVFKDRINTLGDTFCIFDNIVFVASELSTKDAYERISNNEYEKERMLVLYVSNDSLGFWGRMNTKLWTWLKEKEDTVSDGIAKHYVDELKRITAESLQKDETILQLKNELTEKNKAMANQYEQIQKLQDKLNPNTQPK